MNDRTSRGLLGILVLVVIAAIVWGVMTMPDNRTTGQRLGDAVDALPHGVDKAADELGDHTPGQKLGQAVKDTGQNIKDNTGR